jgi:predicted XRE-type DNA-binding protein
MRSRTKRNVAQSPEEIAKAVGLTAAESKEWQVQYALLKRLQQVVREEGLTHGEVARRGGSSRTRVTAVLNGNLEKASSDLLIRLLGALGYRVKVSVVRVDTGA